MRGIVSTNPFICRTAYVLGDHITPRQHNKLVAIGSEQRGFASYADGCLNRAGRSYHFGRGYRAGFLLGCGRASRFLMTVTNRDRASRPAERHGFSRTILLL